MATQHDDFHGAILSWLGHAPEVIEPGRRHRFATGGKRSDTSGWCLLFSDLRAGVFGCFRAGISETWTATPRECMTPAERAALQRQIAQARAEREREQREAWRKNAERLARLWRHSRPVFAGDAVQLYLCHRLRADSIAVPACIRLHPAMPYWHDGEIVGTWPAMVAPVVGADGLVRALHKTYLTLEGRKADVPGPVKKLSPACGLLAGASIRLHAPRAGVLGVSEGIETALAACCASGVPAVAAYSAGALAGFRWPAGVQRIVVFADHDRAGRDAAAALKMRALHAGLRCSVLWPTAEETDWCDVWAAREHTPIEAGGKA